jgi:hypothetical protein
MVGSNRIITMLVPDHIGPYRVYAGVYRTKNKQKAKKEESAFYTSHPCENTKLTVTQVTFLLKTRLIKPTLNRPDYAKIK